MDESPPSPGNSDSASGLRWPHWLRISRRNAAGVLVLVAIVGGLIAIDRRGGSELGPLDDRAPEVGKLAPQFALRDTDGNVRELSDYRGQVVWVNFWATWCGPCRRELPDIQRIAGEVGDDDLVVLTVNKEESARDALRFWDEIDLGLPILLDSSAEVYDQYRLFGLPDNVFIDRAGMVTGFETRFLTEQQMVDHLATAGLDTGLLSVDRQ